MSDLEIIWKLVQKEVKDPSLFIEIMSQLPKPQANELATLILELIREKRWDEAKKEWVK